MNALRRTLVALSLLAAGLLAAPPAHAVNSPTMSTVQLSTPQVYLPTSGGSGHLTLTTHAVDAVGVYAIGYTFASRPVGKTISGGVSQTDPVGKGDGFHLASGVAQDGIWSATVDFPADSAGHWNMTVVAYNNAGQSLVALGSVDVVQCPCAPAAPAAPKATVVGQGIAAVSWSAPAFTDGLPITSYTVKVLPAGPSITTSDTTATFDDLDPQQLYVFSVTATSANGASGASAASEPLAPVVKQQPSTRGVGATPVAPAKATPTRFSSCSKLTKVYPHGVAKSPKAAAKQVRAGNGRPATSKKAKVYAVNASRLDRDHDGTACEG